MKKKKLKQLSRLLVRQNKEMRKATIDGQKNPPRHRDEFTLANMYTVHPPSTDDHKRYLSS
ncbi:MAG: hypothetical protein K0S25_1406 [Bacillus sp. (in: firmicutes)]|nr:hypothetical protein [Bacillus sp. (in: firmicutes)]